jgi:hypothetical protein
VSAQRILAGYRLIFCTLIVAASVQALSAERLHHTVLLAAVEIAGGLMLLWRRTQWVGASLLLVVFAGAQLICAAEGSYPTRFLQYAASTVLIVVMDRVLSRAHGLSIAAPQRSH